MNEIKCQKKSLFYLVPLKTLDCCWFILHLHVLLRILQRHNSGTNNKHSICCFTILKSTFKVLAFYPLRPQKVSMSHVTESVMEYPRITLCSPAFFTKERWLTRICQKGQKESVVPSFPHWEVKEVKNNLLSVLFIIERFSEGNSCKWIPYLTISTRFY